MPNPEQLTFDWIRSQGFFNYNLEICSRCGSEQTLAWRNCEYGLMPYIECPTCLKNKIYPWGGFCVLIAKQTTT